MMMPMVVVLVQVCLADDGVGDHGGDHGGDDGGGDDDGDPRDDDELLIHNNVFARE